MSQIERLETGPEHHRAGQAVQKAQDPGRNPLQGGPDLDPGTLQRSDVLALQRLVGNRVVAQLLESPAVPPTPSAANEGGSSVRDMVGTGGGSPLSPTTRQTMEDRLGHDLSDVRVHAGDKAAASARSLGADAYTVGSNIVLGAGHSSTGSGDERTLAHELTHVIQQRRGPVPGREVTGGVQVSDPSDLFEREADRVAERVMAGDRAGAQHGQGRDVALQRRATGPSPASGRGPGTVAVQRHASFEHRMLGDVAPADLFALGAHQEFEQSGGRTFINIPTRAGGPQQVQRANIEHVLEQELRRLKVWQQQDPKIASMDSIGNKLGAAKANLETNDPTWNVRLVAIESTAPGGKPLLVTYGELNTLADFYGSVDELKAADPVKRRNVVQSVRAQSYDKLLEIYKKVGSSAQSKQDIKNLGKRPEFGGSFGISSTVDELAQMQKDKKGALDDTTKYKATLGRNACHFAPESWHSWEDHHHKALSFAQQSNAALQAGQHGTKSQKLNEALLYNGFGDHYLQDSYAAGHLVNKTQIMQMYVRYQDKNDPVNKGWATPATWRAFQEMAYNQSGLTDAGQYNKANVGRRNIGGQQVTTAQNPQAVENTQSLPGFDWQDRFQMLGLRVPTAAQPGTPAFKLLVWMQKQHGMLSRYDVNFDRDEITVKRAAIGIAFNEVGQAIRDLLNANILYNVGAISRLGESRGDAGDRLENKTSSSMGTFTLRREWVVSVTGGNEGRFNAATTAPKMAGGANPEYEKMAQASLYKDYVTFMQDSYLQKATNALHDEFCKNGLWVAENTGTPVFKIYGDNAMLNSESAEGVQHSAVTANMSRDAILGMAQTGQEPAGETTADILNRLPNAVIPPGGGLPMSLAQWHNSGALEAWAGPNVFKKMNAVINAAAGTVGASLGKITKDQDVHSGEAF